MRAISILSICLYFFFTFFTCQLKADKNQIKNLKVKDITKNSAGVCWHTEEETIGQINYGVSMKQMYNVAVDANKGYKHCVYLRSLLKGTTYYYRIMINTEDKPVMSKVYLFQTKGIPLPVLMDIKTKTLKPESAQLNYIINTPCQITLSYLNKNNSKKKTITIKEYQEKGILELKNLIPETIYYYSLELKNTTGEHIKTGVFHFTTPVNNLALYKKVIGTFDQIPKDPFISRTTPVLNRITDGMLNYFHSMATSGKVKKNDQFIIIDMGKTIQFSRVFIYWHALACHKDYTISTSIDSKKWQIQAQKINARKGKSIKGEKNVPVVFNEVSFKPIKARYIKLFIKKDSSFYVRSNSWDFVQLMEVIIAE